MKLPKLDFLRIFTYPSVLNPCIWIILTLYTISMLLFSWWTVTKKEDRRYYLVLQNRSNFSYRLRDYLSFWIMIFINNYYWNKTLSAAIAELITYPILSYYKKDDWRYKKKIEDLKRQIKQKKNKTI